MALLVNEDLLIQTGGSARSHDVAVWKVSSVEGFYCSSIKYQIFEKNSVFQDLDPTRRAGTSFLNQVFYLPSMKGKNLRFDCVKGLTGQCNTHKVIFFI